MSASRSEFSALLHSDSLHGIFTHCSDCYPAEACGFVYADGSVHAATNIQSELKQADPHRVKRDSRTAYTFSVLDLMLMTSSFETNNPVSVIYHSHPDVGAYFSDEDNDKALFMGQPVYPVVHLVVDVRKRQVQGALLFRWNGRKFEQCQSYPPIHTNSKVQTITGAEYEYV